MTDLAELPDWQTLPLTEPNIALIQRLVDFNVADIFNKANAFNNQDVSYPAFIFASDPKTEQGSSPQRVFKLRAIVHHHVDIEATVDNIRRTEKDSAVRVIRLSYNNLHSAIQYDPLEGLPNRQVPISS